jgi:hypothetical protein
MPQNIEWPQDWPVYYIHKTLLSFSQCTQRTSYNNESSFVEKNNFFNLECTLVVFYEQ